MHNYLMIFISRNNVPLSNKNALFRTKITYNEQRNSTIIDFKLCLREGKLIMKKTIKYSAAVCSYKEMVCRPCVVNMIGCLAA